MRLSDLRAGTNLSFSMGLGAFDTRTSNVERCAMRVWACQVTEANLVPLGLAVRYGILGRHTGDISQTPLRKGRTLRIVNCY